MSEPTDPTHAVVSMKVEDLVDAKAEYNPRRISRHDFEALCASIRRFGFVEPVVLNTRTGNLVGGHQRVDAAAAIELDSIPVRCVDLDEREERALNIALNRISGDWDWECLAGVVRELDDDELVALTGFKDYELEPILGSEWDPDRHANRDKKRDASGARNVRLTANEYEVFLKARDHFRVAQNDPDISEGLVVMQIAKAYLREQEVKK